MTYTRARLFLGMIGVGFWVILSAVALGTNLPNTLFALPETDASGTANRLLMLIAAYIVISLPFDCIGGYILPRRFNRPTPTLPAYLVSWLRGVLVQGVIMFAAGMLYVTAGRQSGSAFLVVILAGIVMLGLLAFQGWIARLQAGFSVIKTDLSAYASTLKKWHLNLPDNTTLFKSRDMGFVGALTGLPGIENLVLPAAWLEALPEDQLVAQLARRVAATQTGARERGVYLALLWNVIGLWVATSLAGTEAVSNARGLFTTVLYFNLWSFIGLLILPSLSRPAVYEVDLFARKAGVQSEPLQAAITTLDTLQGDESPHASIIDTVFSSVPSVEKRAERLHYYKTARGFGFWYVAQTSIYLSWACLGCLSHVVHNNVGLPELWAMLPGD